MKRILIIVLFCASLQIGKAQTMELFIENFKEAYDSKKQQVLGANESLIYVPSIMNFFGKDYFDPWVKLSVPERQNSLWSFIDPPLLANDFAIDPLSGKYFYFPEGWLYYGRDPIRANRMVELKTIISPSDKAIKEYLQENPVDYAFTIINLDYYGSNYWVIRDDQLIVLLYNEETSSLDPVSAELFVSEYDSYFRIWHD